MNNHRKISGFLLLVGAALLLLWPPTAKSQSVSGIGYHAAPFLRISPYARQVGMGEAFTAMSGDIHNFRYNIAGLGAVRYTTLASSFHSWIDDTQQGALALAVPSKMGVFGVDITYFNEGTITEVNENFIPTGATFSSNDMLATFGYAKSIELTNMRIDVGAGAKYIYQNLVGEVVSAAAVDLGIQFHTSYFSFGGALQNFGLTDVKFDQFDSPLPQTYRGGAAVYVPMNKKRTVQLNLVGDALWTIKEDLRYNAGAELDLNNLFFLRGGYKFSDAEVSPWAFGFSLNIATPWLGSSYSRFDYAYAPLEAFDTAAHRFSVNFAFGAYKPAVQGYAMSSDSELEEMRRQLQVELEATKESRRNAEQAEQRILNLEKEIASRLTKIEAIDAMDEKIRVTPVSEDKKQILINYDINFEFAKDEIRPEEYETLSNIGEILNTYPEAIVHVSGHTDSIGTEAFNLIFSQRRVDSVMTHLINREGVSKSRFYMPIGYGELRPVADNGTEEGRFKNRRVEFMLFTFGSEPKMPVGSGIKNILKIDETTIKIELNGKAEPTVSTLQNPDRIILDFPNIFKLYDQEVYELQAGPFKQARVGFHAEDRFTRVVLDLTNEIAFDVFSQDNFVIIKQRR